MRMRKSVLKNQKKKGWNGPLCFSYILSLDLQMFFFVSVQDLKKVMNIGT